MAREGPNGRLEGKETEELGCRVDGREMGGTGDAFRKGRRKEVKKEGKRWEDEDEDPTK